MQNFDIKLNLQGLRGAFTTNIKGKSETKRCLVIPIDDANLFVGEKGCYANFTAVEMKEVKYDNTHILRQQFDKEFYEKLSDEDKKQIPIVGQMKPLEFQQKTIVISGTIEADPNDDLPF